MSPLLSPTEALGVDLMYSISRCNIMLAAMDMPQNQKAMTAILKSLMGSLEMHFNDSQITKISSELQYRITEGLN